MTPKQQEIYDSLSNPDAPGQVLVTLPDDRQPGVRVEQWVEINDLAVALRACVATNETEEEAEGAG